MLNKIVLITGANGAIGQGLCEGFKKNGWLVIGTDYQDSGAENIDNYISIDLDRLCNDAQYCKQCIEFIHELCHDGLDLLINNAATQILAPITELSFESWKSTININLNSVFILIKSLVSELEVVKGSVINISSIHAQLTKPNFSAYSTSKAGLIGLTRSLSVELGAKIRVNAINPAAISTPMLESGFAGNKKARDELDFHHPTCSIGTINDVVKTALYLSETDIFVNGTIINIDDGISSRLHDPI